MSNLQKETKEGIMNIFHLDQTTLANLLALPSAIVSIAAIINYIQNIMKGRQAKRNQRLVRSVPPGCYRKNFLRIGLYFLLLLPLAAQSFIFFQSDNIFGKAIAYGMLFAFTIVVLMIILSIYAMITKQ